MIVSELTVFVRSYSPTGTRRRTYATPRHDLRSAFTKLVCGPASRRATRR